MYNYRIISFKMTKFNIVCVCTDTLELIKIERDGNLFDQMYWLVSSFVNILVRLGCNLKAYTVGSFQKDSP